MSRPFLVNSDFGSLPLKKLGDLLHLGRIGAARMQERAAGAVDGARVLAIQRQHVPSRAGGIVRLTWVRPSHPLRMPTTSMPMLTRPVNDILDDGIETWDVAAAGQDTDSLGSHELSWLEWINSIVPIEFRGIR